MKSIIQDDTTIAKAIENGWKKLGKPKEFTVRIFEEPIKNFIGYTTRSAKVGLFIDEKQTGKAEAQRPIKRAQHRSRNNMLWRRPLPQRPARDGQPAEQRSIEKRPDIRQEPAQTNKPEQQTTQQQTTIDQTKKTE